MNLFFFDTETTGLPDWSSPSDAPHQPHVIQAAGLLCDHLGNELDEWSTLIQPGPGAVMAPEAFNAHGISLEKAQAEGVPLAEAWQRFAGLVDRAEGIVGHNISFDIRMMRIASAKLNGVKWDSEIPSRCTMKMATKILNLPPTERMKAAGRFHAKPPNLTECVRFFFNEDHGGAHDALADVRASKRVYFAIKERLAA